MGSINRPVIVTAPRFFSPPLQSTTLSALRYYSRISRNRFVGEPLIIVSSLTSEFLGDPSIYKIVGETGIETFEDLVCHRVNVTREGCKRKDVESNSFDVLLEAFDFLSYNIFGSDTNERKSFGAEK